ncbi:Reticulon-4-interacting protein 1 [Lasiodiplodia theobromae]|uniref:Reticulon-4-interacting protein 1 n=1 Tax=Lasiodiplodia theobromae TaxID=45133 RepID=A0A5N5D6Y4_9PEZI|nr:Reticulon-4-interacting protein 1 [Lasiodiplodia theobromae]
MAAPTMKAWQFTTAHPTMADALRLNPAAPAPTESSLTTNQLLIKVSAAALNPIDYKAAELGLLSRLLYLFRPHTPGSDFAGTVAAAHPSVAASHPSLAAPGTPVFGTLDVPPPTHGSLGQYVVAKTNECAALSPGIPSDDAAAVPMVGLTALQCLTQAVGDAAAIKPGAKVLINGGSGGTGTMGIQIAKALGAGLVVATCSGANAALCRGLGADEVWDYREQDVVGRARKSGIVFDLIVDNVGSAEEGSRLYEGCEAFLKEGGAYVQVGAPLSWKWVRMMAGRTLRPAWLGGGKRKFVFYTMKPDGGQLAQLAEWMGQGKLKPVVEEKFDMEHVPEAYRKLRQGRTKGKLVVQIDE